MEWVLIIYLSAGFGKDKKPVSLEGERTYHSERDYHVVAQQLLQWLTQDGVSARYRCYSQPRVAGGVQ